MKVYDDSAVIVKVYKKFSQEKPYNISVGIYFRAGERSWEPVTVFVKD